MKISTVAADHGLRGGAADALRAAGGAQAVSSSRPCEIDDREDERLQQPLDHVVGHTRACQTLVQY